MIRTALVLAAAALAAASCSATGDRDASPPRPTTAAPSRPAPGTHAPRTRAPRTNSLPTSPPPTRSRTGSPVPRPDPRWRFYTDDHHLYSSAWFAGRHPIMVPFGCTPDPFYDRDPTCPGHDGRHHGIDVAMPCGTPLYAGRAAEVLDHGSLGPAYGVNAVLLRVGTHDVVIGHTLKVFVRPGDQVRRGERFALAADSGAPDGCHLHFEVRPAGADYTAAIDPRPLLGLRRAVAGAP